MSGLSITTNRDDRAGGTEQTRAASARSIQMPRMNSIIERWAQTCRHELLDRILVWNRRHLLRAPHEYEQFHNHHRPQQCIANARPLQPLPASITSQLQIIHIDIRRRPRWAASSTTTTTSLTCADDIFGKRRGLLVDECRISPGQFGQPGRLARRRQHAAQHGVGDGVRAVGDQLQPQYPGDVDGEVGGFAVGDPHL
jgi:hypothetical protein